MPRKTHHRSRSSVDRVLDLLSELDETQMEALLLEAESTVSGNIPVAKGIDFFERPGPMTPTPPQPQPPPRRKFLTSLSPRKQTELRRRQSRRASVHQDTMAALAGNTGAQLSSPPSSKKTPRSYKRISRPIFSLPTPAATADLSELLAAYLLDATSLSAGAVPSSPSSSSALSSPTTPRSIFSLSPYVMCDNDGPGLDLLEPSPTRAIRPGDIFGAPVKEPTRNISGIFEVLDDAELPTERRI
ncbi:hypothetical protein F5Y16DRAFT_210199 [Xylariaceae sp. FL0255]|nr:hypothetical protein F5Y16DRAFT_210199 [Xylariaceae sp. FL0255]